jgi:hypothetical protein
MKVKVNTKKNIMKSFMGWIPLALVAVVFYGMIFVLLTVWLLENFAGIDKEQATPIAWVVVSGMVLFGIYAYTNQFTNSLHAYRLSFVCEGDVRLGFDRSNPADTFGSKSPFGPKWQCI